MQACGSRVVKFLNFPKNSRYLSDSLTALLYMLITSTIYQHIFIFSFSLDIFVFSHMSSSDSPLLKKNDLFVSRYFQDERIKPNRRAEYPRYRFKLINSLSRRGSIVNRGMLIMGAETNIYPAWRPVNGSIAARCHVADVLIIGFHPQTVLIRLRLELRAKLGKVRDRRGRLYVRS